MSERKITNPLNVQFEPFDNYGPPIPGMNWHKISYNKETGQGSYILKWNLVQKVCLINMLTMKNF